MAVCGPVCLWVWGKKQFSLACVCVHIWIFFFDFVTINDTGEKEQCCRLGVHWWQRNQGEKGFSQPGWHHGCRNQHQQWSNPETWHLHQQRQTRISVCWSWTWGECLKCAEHLRLVLHPTGCTMSVFLFSLNTRLEIRSWKWMVLISPMWTTKR